MLTPMYQTHLRTEVQDSARILELTIDCHYSVSTVRTQLVEEFNRRTQEALVDTAYEDQVNSLAEANPESTDRPLRLSELQERINEPVAEMSKVGGCRIQTVVEELNEALDDCLEQINEFKEDIERMIQSVGTGRIDSVTLSLKITNLSDSVLEEFSTEEGIRQFRESNESIQTITPPSIR